MTATDKKQAWKIVDEIFPSDYNYDSKSSASAGYPVYRSGIEYYDYICDLGDRLEINLKNGKTINIWIKEPEPDFTDGEKCELTRYIDDFLYQLEDKLGYDMTDKKRAIFKRYGLENIGKILNTAYDALNGART